MHVSSKWYSLVLSLISDCNRLVWLTSFYTTLYSGKQYFTLGFDFNSCLQVLSMSCQSSQHKIKVKYSASNKPTLTPQCGTQVIKFWLRNVYNSF